jgi:hypothetical protein
MNPITRIQKRLSDRLYAADDAFAGQAGWAIIKTRGRFGFEGRVYRDPRFRQRKARARTAADRAEASR